jgi:uracil-DNA glycosylase family 4
VETGWRYTLESTRVKSSSIPFLETLFQLQPESPYPPDVKMVLPKPPSGPVRLVAVGEAPGKDEERLGEFFVGKAGQLLRGILNDASILEETYFTNVSWWRPPRTPNSEGDERPGIAVVKSQTPRLLCELALVKPQAVIALGKSASEGISNPPFHRGQVSIIRVAGRDIPVFQTWHPAYIFREAKFYPDIVEDIRRAVTLDIPRDAETSFIQPDHPVQFSGRYVVLDVETTNLSASAEIMCVAARDSKDSYLFTKDSLSILRESLRSFTGKLVAHNAKYDERVLRRNGIEVTIDHDSLLLHLALDNRRGTHSLSTLAPVFGKRNTLAAEVYEYVSTNEENVWENTPADLVHRACAADVVATRDVFTALSHLTNWPEKRLYFFLRRAARPLAEGEQKGILIDREALDAAILEHDRRVSEAHNSFGFDPDSPKQVVEALQREGHDVVSSAENILQRLGSPLARQLLEYRSEAKTLRAFLEPLQKEWIDKDGATHPQVLLHGTDTGRTSCTDPNIQQVPEELRHFFVARPGHQFIGWDMVANEVRCIALLSEDESLCRLLRAGLDPHQEVANATGLTRQQSKNLLFASVYGAGINRLMEQIGITDRQIIYRALETVGSMFPGLPAWKEEVINEVKEKGYVETTFGRKIVFPYQDEKNEWQIQRQAVNSIPQSLGSDIALLTLIRAYEGMGLVPLAFIHDAILIEVPEGRVSEVVEGLRTALAEPFPNPLVEFKIELKTGKNWRDLK